MEVHHFDTQSGLYAFTTTDLTAASHRHPALEIIIAREGHFQIESPGSAPRVVEACIIRANANHALQSEGIECSILLIENESAALSILSEQLEIPIDNLSIIDIPEKQQEWLLSKGIALFNSITHPFPQTLDERIRGCLAYIDQHHLNPRITRKELAEWIHLSPSRLSHLFKSEMGLSIQNYIVWVRLKYAIRFLLRNDYNLVDALYTQFYDPAHFSKAFRKMFGLNPSSVYNSSLVQISKRGKS